jgi:cellulose synthase/poly-beta-1,6-N-acetylglucosamine synthase-like glycosyltransferase
MTLDSLPAVLIWVSTGTVVWVYAGYPVTLALLGLLFGRPRRRAPITPSVAVVVAAHDEEERIGAKIANIRASRYPRDRLEVVVASDGSGDRTAHEARRAGADAVIELPRVGKLSAINAAVERSAGEILVFTDADSTLEPESVASLVSSFADPDVGAATANVVRVGSDGVAGGEGLYWRYDQWIKRLEDRLGSAVSADGNLYAVRRELFEPSGVTDGTDDFVISTQVIRAGRRLAFEDRARVLVERPGDGRAEFRRKVRVMNRGMRAAFSLGSNLLPWNGGWYSVEVVSHKLLRRLVPLFLLAVLASSAWLAAARGGAWWAVLLLQLGFYVLAGVGAIGRDRPWGRARILAVPFYFCLVNAAAGAAVLSLLRGTRFRVWQPERDAVQPRRHLWT